MPAGYLLVPFGRSSFKRASGRIEVKPEGLYLGWVDFRECGLNKDELEKTMLEKAGLWLDEGYIFGTGGEGFERFNLAIPRSVLEDACQRLLKAFGK